MLFTYQQAKSLFNSYVKTHNQEYLPAVYQKVQADGETGIYTGLIMMWSKKDISDSECTEAIRELKTTYHIRAVKNLTMGE